MYDELVKQLRNRRICIQQLGTLNDYPLLGEAADAIEELKKQRDRAYNRLCDWCGVCPQEHRNVEDCEIAEIGPEYTSTDWTTCVSDTLGGNKK